MVDALQTIFFSNFFSNIFVGMLFERAERVPGKGGCQGISLISLGMPRDGWGIKFPTTAIPLSTGGLIPL